MLDLLQATSILFGDCSKELDLDDIYIDGTLATSEQMTQITAKATEIEAERDSTQYQRDRQYAPTGDQLDMLWHTIDEGGTLDKTSEFYIANKAVKDANPKP
jgi:hypothetical protein